MGTVTLSAIETPASLLLLDVAEQAGVSVVVPDGADEALLTVDYQEVGGQQVLEAIADRLKLAAEFEGGVVVFVDKQQASRDYVVLRSGYTTPAVVVEALRAIVGDEAKVTSFEDRIVVAGARRAVQTAADFREQLQIGPDAWRLEVRVVSVSETFRRSLGLDWTLAAEATATAGTGSLSGVNAAAVVSVIAEATEHGRDATLLNAATLYCLEGSSARMNQGDRVPIPRYQTSPEGTTTLVGYEYVNTGFTLSAEATRVPAGVRLKLMPSISSVTGYIESAPITTESRVEVETVVADGGWLVVSGLSSTTATNDASNLPGLSGPFFGRKEVRVDDASILFLLRADRVFAAGTGKR